MIIAQITDTHLLAPDSKDSKGQSRAACLRAVVADINASVPEADAVIHTGDMVHTRAAGEYALAREIMQDLNAPLYAVPGNRDSRASLRRTFGADGYLAGQGDEPILYAVDDLPARLIGFDSLSGTSPKGDVDPERLAWLDATLSQDALRPACVLTHHPPVAVTTAMEPWQYERREAGAELAQVIARHTQIARIFCGHSHRPFLARFGGSEASSVPSIAADLRKGRYPPHLAERPVYQVHRLGIDGRFNSETRWPAMRESHVAMSAAE